MSHRALVATRKGLFTIERTAGRWEVAQAAFVGDNCSMVLHDPRHDRLHAALGHGHFGVKMHRSDDGGRTWRETPALAYPPKPDDVPDVIDPNRNKVIPWTLELVWALETGGANEPNVLWCGTLPGGLFRSDDGGESWRLNLPLWMEPARREWFGGGYDLPGIHSICVDPRDARRVSVAISCGGVWQTRDGGASWQVRAKGMRAAYMPPERAFDPNIQDPHLMVQCRAAPDCLWVQHHNGVFRTTDDCGQWHELENLPVSSFGFAVAVHPRDPNVAWVVPAHSDQHRIPVDGRVIVNRTRDGGKSWQTLSSGLPGTHAYDLVFRHALAVDETGDCLMFGSTTGSLFVSEDGGDRWQTVSSNLPPVHCVRFA